ncbi:MAG TPA: Gfo/Idh/MocA family oxidoreductase [Chloroflexia bacterium]|nr:Gfo/Idh/MocA family oxidoreductase [Chloroflexia bacterium]
MAQNKIGVALIGTGKIALANHLPGIQLCSQAEMVALCDSSLPALQQAGSVSDIDRLYTDYHELLQDQSVQAVIIATPNITHKEIVLAAAAAGKHVLCEKPIALNYSDALEMYEAAERAGIRHMTAFTYRFVPAMRYIKHLVDQGFVGTPYHFRANRFQDWGNRFLAWRQVDALAGSGELGDMLSHRLDFGHFLVGELARLVAQTKRLLDNRIDPQGNSHPSDVDDWVACLGEFVNGATAVYESTKMATGRGEGGQSQDYCEINGSDGTLIYMLEKPFEIKMGKPGGNLETVPVPEEFLKVPGSPRDPREGDPIQTFRYDQDFEFIQAIEEGRPCSPSLYDGMRVQAVMEAILQSASEQRWVEVPGTKGGR